NTGTVDVQDGLLQMTGRGTHTDAIITGNGALEFGGNFGGGITYGLDADTTVRVANLVVTHAIMNLAGTYEPTGPTISTKVNGSAVANFTGPIPGSVGDLTINNESTANFSPPGGTLTASTYTQTVHSTLTGSGDLTITGQVSWNQGTMAGTGKTLATGDIQLWGGALQRNLKSAGTTTWHSGSITIDSPAVWTNTGVFDAQASGSANATMGGSGGTFDNQGTFQKSTPGTTKVEVPFNNTNTGTVDVQTNGLLHFKVSAPYTQTGGVTSLNGGDIRTDHLTGLNLLGGYLLGDGLITGNVTNAGGAVAVSAGFTPPGTMSIDGNYWQGATGLLRVRVLATGVDLISISGSAALDGALLINTGGFVPSLGTSYVPLTYAPRMGCFRRIAGLTIDATKAFEPTFNPTELILSVTDTPRNLDCNGNLVLDECDLSSGASDDCQPNGIPDECDIADGTSQDCPMDGVPDGKPDECQDGKCCLPDSVCLDRDRSFCLTAGGDWRGPCRTCPFQNGVEFYEGDGSIFVHRIGPPVDCGGLSSRAASGGCTPGGTLIDTWESQADAAMCHQFGVPGSPAIPADFFDTGSSPFTGPVCLQGLPLGPTPWGEFGTADTLIARTEDPFEHCDLPSAAEVTVSIELVALSLESVAPITVMVNGQPEDWDVFVDLSTVAPPLGMLTATKSHCNGGTYTSVLNVLPRFTFTKVSDPGQVRVLDTGVEGIEPVVLPQNTPAPWVSDVDPELGLSGDVCSYFHAGIEEPVPPASCDCNANLLNDACELDCNANAVPDDCDAPGDFEADGDWDLADFLDFSACFTGACPAPPCDPALYTDECCLIADFEPDGDVDYDDLAQFVSGLTGPQ
ncbi:MAG: hypothetical protein GY778_17885, partial [bacterium]|nr:hypothetical protein [bacterium]